MGGSTVKGQNAKSVVPPLVQVEAPLPDASGVIPQSSHNRYRADIDGLRALAVLPVVLFHAGVPGMSGGFVGVDVFFVISGFLITAIVWSEVREGRFSLARFYERRIRRIFPALAAMLVAVAVAAAVLFLPTDFRDVPASILAALGFASNFLFYSQVDYFDVPAKLKPLLHTWSLAVEEQFYLGFPVALALLHRVAPHRTRSMLVVAATASFALSVWAVAYTPVFAFYMLPTRAWELFAGSLLAMGIVPPVHSPRAREAISACGIVLIGLAVVRLTETSPFPGATALLPVLGSVAILHCAPGTRTAALLSNRWLVFIGLISYSLYLWHWPIIVFAQYWLGRTLSGWSTVAAILGSVTLAALSWRFVEQPFRDRRSIRPRRLLYLAAGGTCALVTIAIAMMAMGGWPSRFSPDALRIASFVSDSSPLREECHRGNQVKIPLEHSCRIGADVPASFALWGDSHAVELAYLLAGPAKQAGVSIEQITSAGCAPIPDLRAERKRGCRTHNQAVQAYLTRTPRLTTIVLVMRSDWDQFRDVPGALPAWRRSVQRLLALDRRVVIFDPIPQPPASVPRAAAVLANFNRDPGSLGSTLEQYEVRNAGILAVNEELEKEGAVRIRTAEFLCPHRWCGSVRRIKNKWTPLYFDESHLSLTGAKTLIPALVPILQSSSHKEPDVSQRMPRS